MLVCHILPTLVTGSRVIGFITLEIVVMLVMMSMLVCHIFPTLVTVPKSGHGGVGAPSQVPITRPLPMPSPTRFSDPILC